MAQQHFTKLIDDLDGKPADETVIVIMDGTQYKWDLRAVNAKKMRADFQQWMDIASDVSKVSASSAGRASGRARRRRRQRPQQAVAVSAAPVSSKPARVVAKKNGKNGNGGVGSSGHYNGGVGYSEIRAWCAANGVEVAEKGRVPNSILAQYKEAMSV
jgi:DNA segregation ATPase FtsK/SpoIIIE-like protein